MPFKARIQKTKSPKVFELLPNKSGSTDDLFQVLEEISKEKASFLGVVGNTETGILVEVGSAMNAVLLPLVMFGV